MSGSLRRRWSNLILDCHEDVKYFLSAIESNNSLSNLKWKDFWKKENGERRKSALFS